MRKLGIRKWTVLTLSFACFSTAARGDEKAPEARPEVPGGDGQRDEAKKDAPKKEDVGKAVKKAGQRATGAEKLPQEILNAVNTAEQRAMKALDNASKVTDEARKALEAVEINLDAAPARTGEQKKEAGKPGPGKEDPARNGNDARPSPKKPPAPSMFRLRDGTRLAGTPELKTLNVKTAYGKLLIPIADVLRLRFAALEDKSLSARIAEQVKELSSEEFDRREEAMAALREIGEPALQLLRKAVESDDEEVKSRAEKLISEIEETMDEAESEESLLGIIPGDEDEVVTLKFTVRGRVEEEKLALQTRYGSLTLGRDDIVSIVFQEGPDTKLTFSVPGGTFAAANKWVDTKLVITQGQRLHITASGQLNLENYGQATGPEGTTNIGGNQLETHPSGALVGKIGNGKPFLIGAEYESDANSSGTLRLGVSLNNGEVSGQYQVEVEKAVDG